MRNEQDSKGFPMALLLVDINILTLNEMKIRDQDLDTVIEVRYKELNILSFLYM